MKTIGKKLIKNISKKGTFSRWGGDEFILLLNIKNETEMKTIVQNLENDFAALSIELNLPLSASIGVSVYPDNGKNLDDLIHEADKNMYKHKRNKKEELLNNNDEGLKYVSVIE